MVQINIRNHAQKYILTEKSTLLKIWEITFPSEKVQGDRDRLTEKHSCFVLFFFTDFTPAGSIEYLTLTYSNVKHLHKWSRLNSPLQNTFER